jgi:hypothetical protein
MTPFPDIDQLNPAEQKFLTCLEAVSGETMWGLAISRVMESPTATKIRQLVQDLKSQQADAPEVMLSILGHPCYLELVNL